MEILVWISLVSLSISNVAIGYFFFRIVREIRWTKETEITKQAPVSEIISNLESGEKEEEEKEKPLERLY